MSPRPTSATALATGDMGFLHSFTTGSTVDGPGVRVVAWTTGCMWRCLYCHNPDTWTMTNGIPVTVAQAAEELRKYQHGLKVMAGGFTLSGGEPLMQDRFAVKLFAAAQGDGHPHRARHQRLLRRPAQRCRARARSISCCSTSRRGTPSGIARLTGMDNAPTLAFARRLAARQAADLAALRPGARADRRSRRHRAASRGFAAGLGNVERVDVLPFHQMGKFKWKQLGMPYSLETTDPPDQGVVERACGVFRAAGLRAL